MILHDDLLVVVPLTNAGDRLEGLLGWIGAQCGPRALIVIVDGGSVDESLAVAQRIASQDRRFRLLANPRLSPSTGINAAVARYGSKRRWLIRIDADVDYPQDTNFICRLISEAHGAIAASVVVPIVALGEGVFGRASAAAQNTLLGGGAAAHRRNGASRYVDHGRHALMDLTAFRALGGYDESFSHNEEAELDLRFARSGARLWLAADLPVSMRARGSVGALFEQYHQYGRGRAMTALRHGAKLKLRQRLPLLVAPSVLVAAVGVLTAPLTPFSLVLAAPAVTWGAVCLGAGLGLALRSFSPATAASGPAAMIMHLAWSIGFWRQSLSGALCAPLLPLRPLKAG